jgi:hypothetical protein
MQATNLQDCDGPEDDRKEDLRKRYLANFSTNVLIRALDLAERGYDNEDVRDAVVEDITLNVEPLEELIKQVMVDGVRSDNTPLTRQIMTVLIEYFKEEAQNQLLEEAGLL